MLRISNLLTSPRLARETDAETVFLRFYPLDLFTQANQLLQRIHGNFKVYDAECRVCGGRNVKCLSCQNTSDVKHKAVNIQDILHMLMAESFKCDSLITADKAFDEIRDEARPVVIRILQ